MSRQPLPPAHTPTRAPDHRPDLRPDFRPDRRTHRRRRAPRIVTLAATALAVAVPAGFAAVAAPQPASAVSGASAGLAAQTIPAQSIPAAGAAPGRDSRGGGAGTTSGRSRAASTARTARTAPAAPAPAAATTFVSRTTAAPQPVVDSRGRVWAPRSIGWGTWRSSTVPATTDIARTADDALYRVNAWGIRWYRLEVPAAATYRVRLHMAENFWSQPGKRVFDIRAEGRVVARGVDIYRSVGRAAAQVLTLDVPVRDGRLDLDFVSRADNPLVNAVEVVSTTRVAAPAAARATIASTNVPVSPRSFWRTSIRHAPLAPNSARTVAIIAANVRDHWGGNAAFNTHQYNTPIYRVPPGQRRVRVAFEDCQRKGYLPDHLLTGRKQFVDVPVPSDAVPATGTDRAMTIYDPSSDKAWEFWQMKRTGPGAWSACWGGRIDDVSRSQGIFPWPYGSTATGLMLGAGVVTVADIRRGRIDHAIPLAVIDAAPWHRYSWPANRSDGNSTRPDAVMEGQRLRLDPRLDVDRLGLTPVGRIIARAAQEYGFVVVDKGHAIAVIGESGDPVRARTGINPWDEVLGDASHLALRGFPWEKLQALPRDYGK